jgi:hypothetical protein
MSSTGRHNATPNGTNTYSFSQSYDSIHNITHKTERRVRDQACVRKRKDASSPTIYLNPVLHRTLFKPRNDMAMRT